MEDSTAAKPRWSVAPYLAVDDVIATANYYRDKLGFDYDRLWNDPPSFCVVHRNWVVIMLAQLEQTGVMRPNRTVDPEGGAWAAVTSTSSTATGTGSVSARTWRLIVGVTIEIGGRE